MRKLVPFGLRLIGIVAATRHFLALGIVPILAMMLAFPASAQVSSDSEAQSAAPPSESTSTNPNKK